MKSKIKIEVVSDVVCPWCYIGKRRLEGAIGSLKDDYDVEVTYLPFQLSPDTPADGENMKQRLIEKFGGEERFHQIINQVSEVAAKEGLKFDLENQEITPNTHPLHRVVWYAQKQGKQLEMVESFFKAYFEDAMDLSQNENVIKLAASIGLNQQEISNLLSSDSGKPEIDQLFYQNRLMGISSVPYYIINEKYSISGAQPTELFLEALPKIAEMAPLAGETCDVNDADCLM